MKSARPLVLGFIERISSKAFEDFPKQVTTLIGKKHGIYALYKGDRLYYVGLATNLRNRVKHHRVDRHKGKWDKFSLYLVRKVDHIKELESLLLRIADPTGNRTLGKLAKAENMKKALDRSIAAEQARLRGIVMGGGPAERRKQKANTSTTVRLRKKTVSSKGAPSLAGYVSKRFMIKRTYKGKEHKAWVLADGTIRLGSKIFNSPSMAGCAIVNRACDGWTFWKLKNSEGRWVPLDVLRKKQK